MVIPATVTKLFVRSIDPFIVLEGLSQSAGPPAAIAAPPLFNSLTTAVTMLIVRCADPFALLEGLSHPSGQAAGAAAAAAPAAKPTIDLDALYGMGPHEGVQGLGQGLGFGAGMPAGGLVGGLPTTTNLMGKCLNNILDSLEILRNDTRWVSLCPSLPPSLPNGKEHWIYHH